MGTDLFHKTVGVIGTGKIGQAMIKILRGFEMNILAYDPYPMKNLNVSYVSLDEIMKKSDVITLHWLIKVPWNIPQLLLVSILEHVGHGFYFLQQLSLHYYDQYILKE